MKLFWSMFSALMAVIFSVNASHAEENSNFSIGLVAVAGSSIYSNDKTRSAFMPSLSYNSEKISVSFEKGLSYKFFDDGKVSIGASIRPNLRPYKSSYSTDLAGMKRSNFYDGVLNVSYEMSRGLKAKLAIGNELTTEHNGNTADLSLSQFFPIYGQPIIFTAGAKWYDGKRANYFYGVNSSEVSGQRTQYAPRSATLPYLSINTFHPINKHVNLFANVNFDFFPSNVVNSPIVERKSSASVVIGLNYDF